MSTRWVGICGVLWICGCGGPPTPQNPLDPKTPPAAQLPTDTLFEQVRSGRYQFHLALDDIADALQRSRAAAKNLKGEPKVIVQDAVDAIDGAGARVADLAEDPPTAEAFAKDRNAYVAWRKTAINEANDALYELKSAASGVANLADFAGGANQTALVETHRALRLAIEGIELAIDELGGEIEPYAPADLD